jgi:hypothetical protein
VSATVLVRLRVAVATAALLLALCLGAVRAWANEPALEIAGAVATPQHLTETQLKALPPIEVEVSFHTGHGDQQGKYTGALLWTLMQNAGLADNQGNRPDLRHAIAITGSDGYVVIVSFGEIDPDFAGRQAIIAYARDGKPMDAKDGLRLIVPGDSHGGRDVRDVVKIEVR